MKEYLKQKFNHLAFIITSILMFLFVPTSAFAKEETISSTLKKAGKTGLEGKINAENFNGGIIIIVAISGFWTLACIIFAAMRISGAQGSAQKRVEGIIGLVFAGLGAWMIYNAYSIYGWFLNIF